MPFAEVVGAVEEDAALCLLLDSFILPAEVLEWTVPEEPGASKAFTLEKVGTTGRDLTGDCFFYKCSRARWRRGPFPRFYREVGT